jgi:Na+-transporting NADH:ubiquinone oxidoreductase subunit B
MLRKLLDSVEKYFLPGGKLQKLYPLYEATDTFLYNTNNTCHGAPHIRDGADMKRVMIIVYLASLIPFIAGSYFIGHQALLAISSNLGTIPTDWHSVLIGIFGGNLQSDSIVNCLGYGLSYSLPIYITALAVGGILESIFAVVRGHEINEGFLVTSMLFILTLSPSIPLWQVALGISFGVVFGKEIFGGTGKNFLNPALVGRAFLYFSYPGQISGDAVWTAVDGFSGATALAVASFGGMEAIANAHMTWMDYFIGDVQGSIGETSVIAIVLGGVSLLVSRVSSWRIVLGGFVGLIGTVMLLNLVNSTTNHMFEMPVHWHLVTGGFMFAIFFMATDPISAAMTNKGRFYFGFFIGFMTVIIRVINPAYPEGVMMAILFANIVAPVIDHTIVSANIKRRIKRTKIKQKEAV